MNQGLLFELGLICMVVAYTGYLLYFRYSKSQALKYKQLIGNSTDYQRMFSIRKIVLSMVMTSILVIDFSLRLARAEAIDVNALLFTSAGLTLVGIIVALTISRQYSANAAKMRSKK